MSSNASNKVLICLQVPAIGYQYVFNTSKKLQLINCLHILVNNLWSKYCNEILVTSDISSIHSGYPVLTLLSSFGFRMPQVLYDSVFDDFYHWNFVPVFVKLKMVCTKHVPLPAWIGHSFPGIKYAHIASQTFVTQSLPLFLIEWASSCMFIGNIS